MEPLLVFMLGLLLVFVEVFFFPGLIFPAAIGLLLMLGSLVWGMVDVWPGDSFELNPGMLARPILNLVIGMALAVIGALALAKFIPRSWFWDKMILQAGISGNSQEQMAPAGGPVVPARAAIGSEGIATTDLYPSGEVEVEGRRYQARVDYGSASRGDLVEVTGYMDFGLLVRRKPQ